MFSLSELLVGEEGKKKTDQRALAEMNSISKITVFVPPPSLSLFLFQTTKAFLPKMLEMNHGHIVTVASSLGLFSTAGVEVSTLHPSHKSIGRLKKSVFGESQHVDSPWHGNSVRRTARN